jgi:hypothetical protein
MTMDETPKANPPPKYLTISRDSNLRYLPLVYFLPEELIAKCPTLRKLPRRVREVLYNDEIRMLVEDDAFLNDAINAGALLAWPHLGFSGWKEDYTGYHPAWMLANAISIWAELLDEEIGLNLQALMYIPSSQEIPYFQPDYVSEIMERIVKRAITEHNWQPIFDTIREMPCDEDFERWDSNVRKDFTRKWYHTRSKWVQTVSLEAYMEDDKNPIHDIANTSCNNEERVTAEDFYATFKKTLSKRDMQILELRVGGFTYEQIADKLGYKNHSGVLKRMNAIKKAFQKYENEQ